MIRKELKGVWLLDQNESQTSLPIKDLQILEENVFDDKEKIFPTKEIYSFESDSSVSVFLNTEKDNLIEIQMHEHKNLKFHDYVFTYEVSKTNLVLKVTKHLINTIEQPESQGKEIVFKISV